MYANVNRQTAKQISTTLWKFHGEQQNSQMSEVNSHQDLHIHCSMNKLYALCTSSMKFSKETEKNQNFRIYFTVQTGILLPYIN